MGQLAHQVKTFILAPFPVSEAPRVSKGTKARSALLDGRASDTVIAQLTAPRQHLMLSPN